MYNQCLYLLSVIINPQTIFVTEKYHNLTSVVVEVLNMKTVKITRMRQTGTAEYLYF